MRQKGCFLHFTHIAGWFRFCLVEKGYDSRNWIVYKTLDRLCKQYRHFFMIQIAAIDNVYLRAIYRRVFDFSCLHIIIAIVIVISHYVFALQFSDLASRWSSSKFARAISNCFYFGQNGNKWKHSAILYAMVDHWAAYFI